ncbi:MAG: efflux RND transporter periplasmic adaptor subunit, partial [Deltaproteobacteria bacterium]|nr:efflux RND transporter periplasmic adaptor subunit [Deltaproteobacteria bacterium]
MKTTGKRKIIIILVSILIIAFVWQIISRIREQGGSAGFRGQMEFRAVPVEVAEIKTGSIELRKTFSGTLESPSEFVIAPKIAGRVELLNVDIGDTIKRNQLVAKLDDAEYRQAVLLAEADLAVAKANLIEAKSAYEIAERELKRISELLREGLASDSEYDSAKADQLAKQARLAVSEAQVKRADASLETARIRQGYTEITAGWTGGDDNRTVGERFVNEGGMVSANTPLLSIVELDPILGVIYVSEKDYVYLKTGQRAFLTTDAHPGETFEGSISRIAPVFRQATRQARVELTIENHELRLKPGMFIRTTIVFEKRENALIVPEQALTKRDYKDGIFVINDDRETVRWCPVNVGIREDEMVQVNCEGLKKGLVVTLGQQLLDDGSEIIISGENNEADTADKME